MSEDIGLLYARLSLDLARFPSPQRAEGCWLCACALGRQQRHDIRRAREQGARSKARDGFRLTLHRARPLLPQRRAFCATVMPCYYDPSSPSQQPTGSWALTQVLCYIPLARERDTGLVYPGKNYSLYAAWCSGSALQRTATVSSPFADAFSGGTTREGRTVQTLIRGCCAFLVKERKLGTIL